MSYENEIKHLMRELKFAKSDYLNARLKSEDALRIHTFKTDVETIEFQIEVFEKAAKADEYEVKAKAFDAICKAHEPLERRMSPVTVDEGLDFAEETEEIILKFYESGETNDKK